MTSGYDNVDAMIDEAREDGFREGVAAASCGCPHEKTCPLSDEYQPPLREKLKALFGGKR